MLVLKNLYLLPAASSVRIRNHQTESQEESVAWSHFEGRKLETLSYAGLPWKMYRVGHRGE